MRLDLVAALTVLILGAAMVVVAAVLLWGSAAGLLVAGLFAAGLGLDLVRDSA